MMKYIFSLKNYSPHPPFYILMFLPEVQRGQGKCLKSCNNDTIVVKISFQRAEFRVDYDSNGQQK